MSSRWLSFSVGLLFDPAAGKLDGIDDALILASPEAIDDLVAQQVATPPPGSTVVKVVEGTEDDHRTVTVVLHQSGDSSASVDVTAAEDGVNLVQVQDHPRRDAAIPELSEERVTGLLTRLTGGRTPQGWRLSYARLTLTNPGLPLLMGAWVIESLDIAGQLELARVAFPHLVFDAPEIVGARGKAAYTFAAGGARGALTAKLDATGGMRVELEARP